jgi:hypothetical protein
MVYKRSMPDSKYTLSHHAQRRCAQRSFRPDDIHLIFQYGTPTREGVLLREKDARQAIEELRLELRLLQVGVIRLDQAA